MMLAYKIKRETLRIINQIIGFFVPSKRKVVPLPKLERFVDYDQFRLSEYVKGDSLRIDNAYLGHIVDVIIPVYNGFHYLERLFETLPKTQMKYRWIIVDDKSTDERVLPFLKEVIKGRDNCILIENDENLGFVKSVNKAFSLAENHVALINTDIEVPNMWLEFLMYPIITDSRTASSTPFTNSGTLCSFPVIFEDNSLYLGLGLDVIAEEFRTIIPKYIPLPNGVGFCMGMNFNVLKEIGYFDADTFDKGYGEECDWCQRAIKAGYKNVLVENLFVYHKHGGSFLPEQKTGLLERNLELLGRKHPNIFQDVSQFGKENPHYELREYLKIRLLRKSSTSTVVLYMNSRKEGRFQSQLREFISLYLNDGNKAVLVTEISTNNSYSVRVNCKEVEVLFKIKEIQTLRDIV